MKRLLLSIFLCMLLSMHSFSQKLTVVVSYVDSEGAAGNENIYYDPGQLLTWNDFKSTADQNSSAAAMTVAGFGFKQRYQSSGNNATLTITVWCNFMKDKSWVKDGNQTDYILNHEQHHFDIAFIHTLLFMQKLRAADFTPKNFDKLILKNYSDAEKGMSNMQDQYDTETGNSRLKDQQEKWNQKIAQQLQLLQGVE